MSLPGGVVPGAAPVSNAEQQAETERQAVEQQRQMAYESARQQFEGAKQAAQQQLQDAYNAAQQRYQQAVEEARNIGSGGTPEEAEAAQGQREAATQAAKEQLESDRAAAKEAYDGAITAAQEAQDGAIAAAEQTAQSALQAIDQKTVQQQEIEDQTAQQQEQLQTDISQPYVPGQVPGSTGVGQMSPTEGAVPAPAVTPTPPGGMPMPTPSGVDLDQNGIDDALELYQDAISRGRPGIIGPPKSPVDQSIEAILARAGITTPPRTPGREYTPQAGGQTPAFQREMTPQVGGQPPSWAPPARDMTPQAGGQKSSWQRTPNLQEEIARSEALRAEQMKIDPKWAPQLYGAPPVTPVENTPRAEEPMVPYQPGVSGIPPSARQNLPITPDTPPATRQNLPITQDTPPATRQNLGMSRADEWPRGTALYEDQAAGGWVAVPDQGQARFLNQAEAQDAVRQGAQPVGPNSQTLVANANTVARAPNGDPRVPTDINTVAPRVTQPPAGGMSRADEWAQPTAPAPGGMSRADEWPGSRPAAAPPMSAAGGTPAAMPTAPAPSPPGGMSRADEWGQPKPPAPGGMSRADEWPGTASPSTPSAPPPGMTPTGLTQTNPDGSTADIMWDPATRSTVAVPRAPQTGPAAGGMSRADEWGPRPTTAPGLSRADEWGPSTGNPTAVHTATPASFRNDAVMANPNYSFTRFVQPRDAEEQAQLGTVMDQSLAMYDAQKAGTSRIPLREIPVEEKAIVADAYAALARGDESAQWAVTPLQNAARAAWQVENGDPGVDPKFADPNYVARWVNGFLEGKTDLPYQKELSEDIRRTGRPAPADVAASRNGPSWIGKFGRDLGAGVKVDNEAKQLTVPQTAEMAQRYGLGVNNTYAVCGPIAANGMLRAANGDDSASLDQVWQKALDGKYWNGAWTGPVNYTRFLRQEYNKDVSMVSEMSYSSGDLGNMNGQVRGGVRPSEISQIIAQDVTQGKPVTVSISGSNGHYFVATDYDAQNNKFYVGTTGTVYKGGKEWMSLDEMKTKAGGGGIAAIRFNDTLKGERKGEPFKVAMPGTVQTMDEVDRQSVATAPPPNKEAVTPQYNTYGYTGPVVVNSGTARNGVGEGEIEDFARRAATARGVDPDAVMTLINEEGGTTNPVRQNMGGTQAFGPLQLMRGGVGTQFEKFMESQYGVKADVRDPKWWKAATEFGIEKGVKDEGWYDWEAFNPRVGPKRVKLGLQNNPRAIGISDEALIYAGVKPQVTPQSKGSSFYRAGGYPGSEQEVGTPPPGTTTPLASPDKQGYWKMTGPKGVEWVNAPPPPGYVPPQGVTGSRGYETDGPDSTGRLYPGQPNVTPQEQNPGGVPPPPWAMDPVYQTAAEIKRTPPENIDEAYQIVKRTFDEWGIGDPETVAAAMATMLVETGTGDKSFKPIKELQNLNGTYVTKPSGGTKYVGRGYVQLTHDYNYRDTGKAITAQTGRDVDLEGDPDQALDPEVAAHAMAQFFKSRGIDKMAKEQRWDDIRRAVNGGTTHIAEYRKLLNAMGYGAAPRRI